MTTKLIIHDWDDTITSSIDTYVNWWHEFADVAGLPRTDQETIRFHWGKTLYNMIDEIWGMKPEESSKLVRSFVPKGDYVPPLFDGAKEKILELYDAGYELGFLSSGFLKDIEPSYIKGFGEAYKYHKHVYAHDNLEFTKPDPRAFDPLLKAVVGRIAPNEILYIGDSLYDYYAARDAGLNFKAVTTGTPTKEDFLNAGVSNDQIISSFARLNLSQL